jgi:hypothetical protein
MENYKLDILGMSEVDGTVLEEQQPKMVLLFCIWNIMQTKDLFVVMG